MLQLNSFSKNLIDWYSIVKRDLPWRKTSDPYIIWLSEIILQQTRVDQGLPYFNQFVSQYPTVHDLAKASAQEVMKTWEGLGYYSRARNLHHTAKHISNDLGGKFPDTYSGLLSLKGVGPYTAAAIASIAFGLPTPVLDGNVFRFISRHFGVHKEISDTKNRRFFIEILEDLIPYQRPADFNQAIMEFGATICTPAPKCVDCIFRDSCYAFANDLQSQLPVKEKKVKSKEVTLDYFVFSYSGHALLRERKESIWRGLFEFYGTEDVPITKTMTFFNAKFQELAINSTIGPVKHLLTHRKLWVSFHNVRVADESTLFSIAKELGLKVYSCEEILTLPLPKVIVNHLEHFDF
ncbi:MAG: A/G-specific adenine glycosylase [Cyclobacteriaceae bacterium]